MTAMNQQYSWRPGRWEAFEQGNVDCMQSDSYVYLCLVAYSNLHSPPHPLISHSCTYPFTTLIQLTGNTKLS